MTAIKYTSLWFKPATMRYLHDSSVIVERLADAKITAYKSVARTTKGSRCVRVWVDERKLDAARELCGIPKPGSITWKRRSL